MKVSCIHPGVAPGAVVMELAPEHGCPHGDPGSSSPAAASAPHSLSQPGQMGSPEACCFHFKEGRPTLFAACTPGTW